MMKHLNNFQDGLDFFDTIQSGSLLPKDHSQLAALSSSKPNLELHTPFDLNLAAIRKFSNSRVQGEDALNWGKLLLKQFPNIDRSLASSQQPDRSTKDFLTGISSAQSWIGNTKLLNETEAKFDLNADLDTPRNFYNLPYPMNLRLDTAGHPDLDGLPIANTPLLKGLKTIAEDRPGFPTNSVGYFRFNFPVTPQEADRLIPARRNSPILLIDIDPDSPDQGKLFPVVASTPRPDLNYVPSFLLSVAPYPGIVLHPDRTYAYVVQQSLKDALGRPLGTPDTLEQLIDGKTPQGNLGREARRLYRPLWQTLDRLKIDRQSVAAATVFTTGDVVNQMADLSNQVLDRYDLKIENLAIDPVDGANHPLFYELHGTIRFPQFQKGTPPFNTGGLFTFDSQGQLVEQRTEVAPVVITIPKEPMPEGGYPLMVYYHGSNGLSTQVVDRGRITEPGGQPTVGEGPAAVVAQEGFAAVGSALPLNPERLPNGPASAYLNPLNLAAYRDTFRQGVLEQSLLLEALEKLEIPTTVFSEYSVPSLPENETAFRLQTTPTMVLGQSHGAQYANLVAAVNPKVQGIVPTGSNGFWSLVAAKNQNSPLIGLLLGTLQTLDFLYPGLNLLETAWEAVDPIVYAPRLTRNPLPGHPVRSVYQPVGFGDTEVPQAVFNALALATGVQQAGDLLWSSMQDALALDRLNGLLPYPITNNLLSENGTPYTGVVVQYAGDGNADPHTIFSQLDAVKFQYRQFFKTLWKNKKATVFAPPSP